MTRTLASIAAITFAAIGIAAIGNPKTPTVREGVVNSTPMLVTTGEVAATVNEEVTAPADEQDAGESAVSSEPPPLTELEFCELQLKLTRERVAERDRQIRELEAKVESLERQFKNELIQPLTHHQKPQPMPSPVAAAAPRAYYQPRQTYYRTYSNYGNCGPGGCGASSGSGYRSGPIRRLFGR